MTEIKYRAEPTPALFHADNSFVRGIMGPIGSGKSVAMCMEIFNRCLQQEPDQHGIRRSRWAIVRNTYGELKTTTIKTFLQWIPPSICKMRMSSPIEGIINNLPLPDGTKVYAEFNFIAIDRPDDTKKLLSLELTGAWVNEAREINKKTIDDLTGRLDRYPSKGVHGVPATWNGLIMDTNPPDDDHWWYKLAEKVRPAGWTMYRQPGALIRKSDTKRSWYEANPRAENVENHNHGYQYWVKQLGGKDQEWINVYVLGQYGTIYDGKPVYDTFNQDFHIAKEPIDVFGGLPLFLGWDFGLSPSCIAGQVNPNGGQLRVLREWYSGRAGIRQFAEETVKPALLNEFPNIQYISVGDPAGDTPSEANIEVSCMTELSKCGIPTDSASTNDFVLRRNSVINFLNRAPDGKPGFLLDPSCEMLRKGFNGAYMFNRIQAGGVARYRDVPLKNEYSHPHDALQYLALRVDSAKNNMAPQGRPAFHQPSTWRGTT